MILTIYKNNSIKISMIMAIIVFVLGTILPTKSVQATITIPYSPQIDILNATSSATSTVSATGTATGTEAVYGTLENGSSTLVSINAIKVWQENGEFSRNLKKGSKGNDVMVLQLILKSLTNDTTKSAITTYFGEKTEIKLKGVQSKLDIPVTGMLDTSTRAMLNDLMFKELCPTAIRRIGIDNMVKSDFNNVFENLNRSTSIPLDYIPQDLEKVTDQIKTIGVMCVSDRIVRHLNEMFSDAKQQGLDIAITSSYRSADMQKFLYLIWVGKSGDAAKAGIAEAGHSEHQLGTTIDVSGKSIGYAGVNPRFAKSKEGKWMSQNSYKYGFIMSYPDKKQKETGYIYEPWHFRYIGVDNANDIFTDKITIQDFLNFATTTVSATTTQTITSSSSTKSTSILPLAN